ncbi:hypothetical protein C8R43DRAFT_1132082 [Mycena crocata]|nr:hypothetical protein C8R43DRAFT_1132082 [Mycena crocata]
MTTTIADSEDSLAHLSRMVAFPNFPVSQRFMASVSRDHRAVPNPLQSNSAAQHPHRCSDSRVYKPPWVDPRGASGEVSSLQDALRSGVVRSHGRRPLPVVHPCGLLVTGEALHAQTLVRCTVAGMEEPCHVPGLRLLSFLQPPPSFFFFSHTQPLPRPVVISRALARLRLVLPRVNPAVPSVHPRRCLGVSPALVPTPSRPRPHHPSWRCLAHAPSPPSLCESRSQLLRTLLRRTTSHNTPPAFADGSGVGIQS